jgi:hypothetical protein
MAVAQHAPASALDQRAVALDQSHKRGFVMLSSEAFQELTVTGDRLIRRIDQPPQAPPDLGNSFARHEHHLPEALPLPLYCRVGAEQIEIPSASGR